MSGMPIKEFDKSIEMLKKVRRQIEVSKVKYGPVLANVSTALGVTFYVPFHKPKGTFGDRPNIVLEYQPHYRHRVILWLNEHPAQQITKAVNANEYNMISVIMKLMKKHYLDALATAKKEQGR